MSDESTRLLELYSPESLSRLDYLKQTSFLESKAVKVSGAMPSITEIFPLSAVGAMAIPLVGGNISGYMSRSGHSSWYESLKTPDWKPPRAAFPIVWTSLYAGMGYASHMVWQQGGGFHGAAQLPLIMYGAQLAINFAWSPIFFRNRSIKGGMITILILDAAVVATTFMFYKISPSAGYIMMAYCAWLSLATALNYRIWKDNPSIKEA